MAKQFEIYGQGYKQGVRDCWKEVQLLLKESKNDHLILPLYYVLSMKFELSENLRRK